MKINPSEISKNQESPLTRFYSSFKSDETRKDYERKLKKVMCEFLSDVLEGDQNLINQELLQPKKKRGSLFKVPTADFEVRVNEFVRRAKHDADWAENVIITIIEKLKEKSKLPTIDENYIKPDSVKNYYFPLQKLLEMNKINIAYKLIRKSLPSQEFLDDSRGWTRQEIKKMLEHTDSSGKVLILLASSSGIRAGAFDFRWKHLIPVYQYGKKLLWEEQDITESIVNEGKVVCAMIRIYADSKDQYFAFITPECWNAIQEYKLSWTMEVEKEPKPNDVFMKHSGGLVRPIGMPSVRKRLVTILLDAGLRKPLTEGKRRHEVPAFNGFRRYFNKANKQAFSKNSTLAQLIIKENMMGHNGLIRLDRNYFKTHISELIEEYLNSIPYLTISDSERQKTVIKQQKGEILELQKKEERIGELEYIVKKKDEEVDQKIQNKIEEFQEKFLKQIEEVYDKQNKETMNKMKKSDIKFEKEIRKLVE